MSASYNPDEEAKAYLKLQETVLLSQRDLSLAIPINFITQPAVSFSAACFSNLTYEDKSFETCFSNLLAVGFRRFHVDLYWDQAGPSWTFCPVSNYTGAFGTGAATASNTTESKTAAATGNSIALTNLLKRQVPSSSVSVLGAALEDESTALSYELESRDTAASTQYNCSDTLDLSTMMSILNDYIKETETTTEAHLLSVILNLHATASTTSPSSPASSPLILPSSSALLGSQFSGNLSAYVYTPENLLSDRADLNSTWYTVSESYRPATGYYSVSRDENNVFSTEDGWPTEGYMELTKGKRLLVAYGTIDPQMQNYNFSADADTIFTNDFIEHKSSLEADSSGNITRGCFLTSGTTNLSISNINSSWATSALASDSSALTNILNLTSSITNCGISPILNQTLISTSASTNSTPYQNYTSSTVWSWAPNEPRTWESGDPGNEDLFRCARTSFSSTQTSGSGTTSAHQGTWHVADCSSKNYAACRMPDQPYNWTITTYQTSFTYAAAACPSPYIFAVPRTALENAWLERAIRKHANSQVSKNRDEVDSSLLSSPSSPSFDDGNTGGLSSSSEAEKSSLTTTTYTTSSKDSSSEDSKDIKSSKDITPDTDATGPHVFLNLNSLSLETCWIANWEPHVTDTNNNNKTSITAGTCPYDSTTNIRDDMERRTILVPTIAAIIVLIIGLLTVFVKAVGNRSSVRGARLRSRRRRWGGEGEGLSGSGGDGLGFYEGVPS